MTNVIYNGVNLANFLVIKEIRDSLLPTFSNYSINLVNKPGERFVRSELGARKIDIDVEIIADSESELNNKIRTTSRALYYNTPQFLKFGDRTYKAIIDGSTIMENIRKDRAFTLSFIAHDPLSYGKNVAANMTNGRNAKNSGTHETRGEMSFVASASTAVIRLNGGGTHDYIKIRNLVPGQKVVINTISERIYVNNQERFVDPLGDFFSFPPRTFSFSLEGVSNLRIHFYERWL